MAKTMKKGVEAGATKAGEVDGRRKEKRPMQGGEDDEEGGGREVEQESAGTFWTTGRRNGGLRRERAGAEAGIQARRPKTSCQGKESPTPIYPHHPVVPPPPFPTLATNTKNVGKYQKQPVLGS